MIPGPWFAKHRRSEHPGCGCHFFVNMWWSSNQRISISLRAKPAILIRSVPKSYQAPEKWIPARLPLNTRQSNLRKPFTVWNRAHQLTGTCWGFNSWISTANAVKHIDWNPDSDDFQRTHLFTPQAVTLILNLHSPCPCKASLRDLLGATSQRW